MTKNERSCQHCDIASGADELYWIAAINSWNESGDKSYIIDGLRQGYPMPLFARNFVADLIEEKAKRKPVLKKAQLSNRDRFIRSGYKSIYSKIKKLKKVGKLSLLHGETPASVAIDTLCEIYDLKVETVRSIIRRKKV